MSRARTRWQEHQVIALDDLVSEAGYCCEAHEQVLRAVFGSAMVRGGVISRPGGNDVTITANSLTFHEGWEFCLHSPGSARRTVLFRVGTAGFTVSGPIQGVVCLRASMAYAPSGEPAPRVFQNPMTGERSVQMVQVAEAVPVEGMPGLGDPHQGWVPVAIVNNGEVSAIPVLPQMDGLVDSWTVTDILHEVAGRVASLGSMMDVVKTVCAAEFIGLPQVTHSFYWVKKREYGGVFVVTNAQLSVPRVGVYRMTMSGVVETDPAGGYTIATSPALGSVDEGDLQRDGFLSGYLTLTPTVPFSAAITTSALVTGGRVRLMLEWVGLEEA